MDDPATAAETMLFGLTYMELAIAVGIFVASTLVTTAIVAAFLVSIPPDHFVADKRGVVQRRVGSPALRLLVKIGKNLLGLLLVVVGVVLSLPGVPGQGLLTIFVGVLLLDVPGKHRLERAILRRPTIRKVIDKTRQRFGKPKLILEQATE